MPVGMSSQGEQMTEMLLTAKSGEQVKIKATRPLKVRSDRGELRIWLWSDKIAAGKEEAAGLTFEFPGPLKVETANRLVDTARWIPFAAKQDFSPGSPIGAEAFLDAPAGKHGWVQIKDDAFVFEKKPEPIKFWGTNIAFARMAVAPELAKEWADKFAKYGVNIVRFHKWTGNNGWDGVMSKDDVLEFDEAASGLFDNIHAEFKKRGIYLGWSTIFALKLHESMAKYLANYEEIKAGQAKRGTGLFTNSLYPLQTFAPDVQDLFIAMTVKWLERKNTVTGLRYADDPAVAYVELHNEADIFFAGTGKLVQLYPAYTGITNEKFGAWLAKKYADDGALKEGLKVGSRRISMEELDAGNVGFEERFSLLGGANLKNFAGSVPNEALGAGRVTLDFVDKPAATKVEMSELPKYWDAEQRLLRASNGQILWDYSGRGFFTVDTPAAQAIIGFGGGREHALGDVAVRYDNAFANVYVAAQKPGQTLAKADQIVILTIARTANRGDLLEETCMELLERGRRESKAKSPADKRADDLANPRLLVEPVVATVTLKRAEPCRVFALDHDGCRPAQAVPVPVTKTAAGQQFVLDGTRYRTPYYVVDFGPAPQR